MKKDFLCLSDLSLEELEQIFALAKDLKAKQKAGQQHHLLSGKILGMLFEKSSTRTRVSLSPAVQPRIVMLRCHSGRLMVMVITEYEVCPR